MRKDLKARLYKQADRMAALLDQVGYRQGGECLLRVVEQVSLHDTYAEQLQKMPLHRALWWFIENINDEYPRRSELFFLLRERMRKELSC